MQLIVLLFGITVSTMLCLAFIIEEIDEEENPDLDI